MPQQECEHLYTKKVCGKLQTVKETYWSDRNAWIQTVHEETVRAFTVNTSGEGLEPMPPGWEAGHTLVRSPACCSPNTEKQTNVQTPVHTNLYCLVLILIGCNGTQWSNGFCQNTGKNLITEKTKNNCLQHNIFTVTKQRELLNISRPLETSSTENSLHASLKWVHWPSLGLIDQSTEDLFFCLTAFVAGFDCLWQTNTLEFKKNQHDSFWRLKTLNA